MCSETSLSHLSHIYTHKHTHMHRLPKSLMQVWIASAERESLHAGKKRSVSVYLPHFLLPLSSPSDPLSHIIPFNSPGEPLNPTCDETCTHTNTLCWLMAGQLLKVLSSSSSSYRGGIQSSQLHPTSPPLSGLS